MSSPVPGLGGLRYRAAEAIRALLYRYPLPFSRQHHRAFWDAQAGMIHERWGADDYDFPALSAILCRDAPRAVLDIGCGSGRLFALYRQHGIQDVVGLDISEAALALARTRYPESQLLCLPVEELDFAPDRFDLAISNRVLCCVPSHAIAATLGRICRCSPLVYINERLPEEEAAAAYYLTNHDFAPLFLAQGFVLDRQGSHGEQSYEIYRRVCESPV